MLLKLVLVSVHARSQELVSHETSERAVSKEKVSEEMASEEIAVAVEHVVSVLFYS